jgi:hypothetical protein
MSESVEGTSALNQVSSEGPEVLAASKVALVEIQALEVINAPKMVIRTDAEYKAAGAQFALINERLKSLETERDGLVRPLNGVVDRINALFRGAREQLLRARSFPEAAMKGWVTEQDRLRKEALEKARQEAEAERLRLEKERIEAEAEMQRVKDAQMEAERLAQAETNPFMRAIRQATVVQNATAAAEVTQAWKGTVLEERRLEAAVNNVPIPLVRASGTKVNRPWKWRYVNKAIIPDQYKLINEQLISATVRTLKGDTKIDGIEVYQDIAIGGM